VDSRPRDDNLDAALASTVRVVDVASRLRSQAAASCMVFDTMFVREQRRKK
jgi:hypothetical protein